MAVGGRLPVVLAAIATFTSTVIVGVPGVGYADVPAVFAGPRHLAGVGPIPIPSGFDNHAQETFAVRLGDVTGDGLLDAVSVECAPTNAPQVCALAVRKGAPDGSFGSPVTTPVVGLFHLALGDFNDDGRADAAVIDAPYVPSIGHVGSPVLQIMLSNGDGTFTLAGSVQAAPASPAVFSAPDVEVADVDEDGVPDVLLDADLTGNGVGQVSLFQVDAAGGLSAPRTLLDRRVGLLQIGDFNRDGHADIFTRSAQVLLGDGHLAFQPFGLPLSLYQTGNAAAGDFNGDGLPDIAYVMGTPGHDFLVYYGTASGVWGNPGVRITVNGQGTGPVLTADLDGDGRLDVVAVDGTQQVQAFLNTGSGFVATAPVSGPADPSFAAALGDVTGHGAYTVVIAPIDSDAGLDVYPPATPPDTVPPTVTGVPDRPANPAGWYTAPVTVTWTAQDPAPSSGTPTTPPSTTVSGEGANQTVTSGVSCDPAGNCGTGSYGPVNIDLTPPAVNATLSPTPDTAGWVNQPATVTYACTDTLSGVASCPDPSTVTTQGHAQTVTGTAVDNAGNAATTTTTVNLDRTAPTITASLSPTGNGNGWNNTAVTVTFTCTDTLSGIGSCPAPVVLSGDGAHQVVSGTAVDNAGNTATATVTVSIDTTRPSITASRTGPNSNGWDNTDVTVTYTCADGTSGVASCPPPTVLRSEGAGQSTTVTATDRADNITTLTVTGINIDKTAPTITSTVTVTPNPAGWYTSAPTIRYTCTDTLSGIATCPPDTAVTTDGANQTRTTTGTDRAGNTTTATVSGINLDRTPPAITVAGPQNGHTYLQGRVPVPACASTDTLSGIAVPATLTLTGTATVTATCYRRP